MALSNREVLATLEQQLSPEILSRSLSRVLRIPAAWEFLHQSDHLADIELGVLSKGFGPIQLAAFALDGKSDSKLPTSLSHSDEIRLEQIWEAGPTHSDYSLRDIGLLAVGVVRISQAEPDLPPFTELSVSNAWNSALALAWPEMPAPGRILANTLAAGAYSLAIRLLLSSMGPEQSAKVLLSSCPDQCLGMLKHLARTPEADFRKELAKALSSSPYAAVESFNSETVSALIADSLVIDAEAQVLLEKAWNKASAEAAEIADLMTQAARNEDDSVLELEAAQQAYQKSPTPMRQAELALALTNLGKYEEALELETSMTDATWEQLIATAKAQLGLGQTAQSEVFLEKAAAQIADNHPSAYHWISNFVEAALMAGRTDLALVAAEAGIDTYPANAGGHLTYAKLLMEAGDPYTAAQELAISASLDPGNADSIRLQALSLSHSGDHEAAVVYWEKLAERGIDCDEEMVEAALSGGNVDRAKKALSKMLDRDPSSVQYRILQAKSEFAQGETEKALALLEDAKSHSPETWITKAHLLLENGKGEEALAALDDAAKHFPAASDLERASGRIAAALGKHEKAVEHFQAAQKARANDGELLVELGDALSKAGRAEAALKVLQSAIKRMPRSWSALSKLAILQSNQGNWEAAGMALPLPPATVDLEQATTLSQLGAEAAIRTGNVVIAKKGLAILEIACDKGLAGHKADLWSAMLHESAGDHATALDLYQFSIKAMSDQNNDELQEAMLGLARSALSSDQVALALSTLERAREGYPDSLPIHHLLTTSYLAANLPERAIECAQASIAIDGGAIEAKRLLGLALTAAGRHEESMVAFQEVAQTIPAEPEGWLDLAESAQRADDSNLLRSALAKALSLGRRDASVLRRASDLQVSIGNPKGGIITLQAAADLEPDNADTLTQLATTSLAKGQIERGYSTWMRLVKRDGSDLEAKRSAAEAALMLDKQTDAIALWEQILSMAPKDGASRRALARTYCEIGEVSKGMAEYDQASAYEPDDHMLALEAGKAALRAGSMTDALAYLARASELNPADQDAKLAFAECLAELNRWSDLKEALQSLEIMEGHANALLSHALLGLGEFSEAEKAYEEALQFEVASPEQAIWRSRAAMKLGRWNDVLGPLEKQNDGAPAIREWLSMKVLLHHVRWVLHSADVRTNLPEVELAADALQAAMGRLSATEADKGNISRRIEIALSDVLPGELGDLLLIAKDDESESAAEEFAAAYLRSGRAKEALLMANAKQPSSDLATVLAGLCNEKLARFQFALDDYGEAMIAPAFQPVVHYLLARTYLAMEDPGQATQHLQTAVREWPHEPEWQYQLAQIYIGNRALDGAIGHLQNAVESSPNNPKYNLSLARVYRQANQQARAESGYHRALKGFPEDGELHREAAELSLELGNYSVAAKWFDRAATLLPSDSACLIGGARALIAMRRHAEAAEWVDAAKRIAPDDPEVMLGAAEISSSQGKYELALEMVDKLQSNGKHESSINRVRNHILIRSGRIDEALEGLESVVAEDPSDHHAWHSLALAHESQAAIEAAISASKAAVKLSPDNPEYCLTHGRLCRSAGQLDQALEFLSRAKRSAIDDWRIEYQLGKVYEQRRDLDLALKAYERTSEMDPTNAKAFYRSGLILRSMKSYDRAGQMLRKSVELNPDDRQVLHQLAAVRALELVHGGAIPMRLNP